MSDDDRRWCDMKKREKLALMLNSGGMGSVLNERQRAAVADRVRRWFLTHSMDDPNYCMNVLLRECWRETHGDTEAWDAAASARGLVFE